ncbi:hypothetical protein D3C83_46150 [compost metagenome]
MTEAVGAVDVPHVPQRGAQVLGHADAVAGVGARGGVEYGLALEELRFHFRAALEAAAGENHAAPRPDCAFRAVDRNSHAAYFARFGIGDEPQCGRGEPDLDAAPEQVIVHDLV